MNEIIALIAVKGNSKRIHKKNIRPFHDTNLLQLKLNQIKQVNNIDKIIVSSESKECLDIAKANDVAVHVRDSKYSTSKIPMSEVYSHLASECDGKNIVWIPVTNPLANSEVYEKAIDLYKSMDSKYDCLLSACKFKDYVFYKGKPVGFKPNPWPKSQDLNNLLTLSFVVNIIKRNDMINYGSLVGRKPLFHFLDTIISWDIDFQEDFDFCEMIYKARKN